MRMKGNSVHGGLTDSEIGKLLGLHPHYVSQIAIRAMRKVKERMQWPEEKLEEFINNNRKTR